VNKPLDDELPAALFSQVEFIADFGCYLCPINFVLTSAASSTTKDQKPSPIHCTLQNNLAKLLAPELAVCFIQTGTGNKIQIAGTIDEAFIVRRMPDSSNAWVHHTLGWLPRIRGALSALE
jgi:hypothetical protein